MLTKARCPTIRTTLGWAISALHDAGAIRECEDQGWVKDRADPHAGERACVIAREDAPPGISADEAVAEVQAGGIGFNRRHLSGLPCRVGSICGARSPYFVSSRVLSRLGPYGEGFRRVPCRPER
jgi:hypothetical protein